MTPERWVAASAAVVVLCGSGFVARSDSRARGSSLEPLSLFLFVWGLALGLFALPLVRFTATSTQTWIAIYGSIVTFTVGALIAYRVLRLAPPSEDSRAETIDAARLRIAIAVCAVLTAAGFAAYLRAIHAAGVPLRAVVSDPELVRQAESQSNAFGTTYGLWKLLTYFGQPGFLLWSLAFRVKAFRAGWWAAPLGAVCIVPYIFTTNRVLLVTSLAAAVLFHLTWRPVRSPGRVAVSLLLLSFLSLAVFVGLGLRTHKTIDSYPEVAAQVLTPHARGIAIPYTYVAGAAPVLSRLTADPNLPLTVGASTALPAVKLLHAAGIGGAPPEQIRAYYPIPFQVFNTTPWISDFYIDFRLPGVLAIPGLFGFALTAMTLAVARRRTLIGAWFLSTMLVAVATSPFTNRFTSALTWELAGLGVVICPLLTHDLTPMTSRIAKRLWSTSARRLVTLLASLGLVAALVAITLLGTSDNAPPASNVGGQGKRMVTAAHRARRAYSRGGYPFAATLASQLHQADPGVRYIPLRSPSSLPAEVGVVGVYTTSSTALLRARSKGGGALEVRQVAAGRDSGTYGPVSIVRGSACGRRLNTGPPAPVEN
jgi:oligosaccharide repeat unit polymerase